MIQIINKKDCCGCAACVQRCPKKCINFKSDSEGFLYPIVDADKCIKCGLCIKTCPILNSNNKKDPIAAYAAIYKNETIRNESSSGGMFSLLATNIINEGGVVFGATFDKAWNVIHSYTQSAAELWRFRGSKYVQSDIKESYIIAKNFLKNNYKVLFTGTPCQISGLKHFLNKDYENLITVDVSCHGVPSPKVWTQYLNYLFFKQKINKQDIGNIYFREKSNGWICYNFAIKNSKEEIIYKEPHTENLFMKAFLSNLILRPSCYVCQFKQGKSNSDLTIADYWKGWEVYPQIHDNKGISLVLVNSKKGNLLYNSLKTELISFTTEYKHALKTNHGLQEIEYTNKYRDIFFKSLDKENIEKLIKKYTKIQWNIRIKKILKKIRKKIN
ncbi:Coenzyme F420 hydrogenase/dehydrogenase, beta subunit C-terminal domain [Phocaeicola coprocola]|uniref:Coenzyme F420 hydrogenase/dehydrogenase, beta subunit C-terminal domain n=2 Tax=Phocaeicola coprocola TaxID=310298 RepID=UPI0022E6F6E4|nr:Coenzyme F420 hydrogenase/dehydrogenase, beta subunit C-terminal domain [Phocaeicola coprocola]